MGDLERVTEERDAAYQAMWDMYAALGFDTDGDKTPGAMVAGMGAAGFCAAMVAAAVEEREEYDALLDELPPRRRPD